MKRRSGWLILGVAVAIVGITLTAVPEARAQVSKAGAQVARLFGWNTYEVRQEVAGASTTFERKPADPTLSVLEHATDQRTVWTLAEARALLPAGVALPPDLEGQEMLITRVTEKSGTILAADLAGTTKGFWARYRANGQHDQVHATYDADFTVTTESRTIAGRSFEIVTATLPGGKATVTIWGEDGPWMYEVQGYGIEMERLTTMLEKMN